jgi:hypothetical protein
MAADIIVSVTAVGRHAENQAARRLEERWRLANDHKKVNDLGALLDREPPLGHPLILTNEEMERLGGQDAGYEPVRKPVPSTADFKHRFDLNSREHIEWLEATGTV